MSANPYLELVNRRGEQAEVSVLFVGAALAGAKKVFKRDRDPVRCQHAASSEEALDILAARAKSTHFDCVMMDMRHENDGEPLNVVALATLNATNRLVVLANPDQVAVYEDIEGVDLVLQAPVDPQAIIAAIVESALHRLDSETSESGHSETPANEQDVVAAEAESAEHPAAAIGADEAPVVPTTSIEQGSQTEKETKTTPGFETTLSRAVEADHLVWQRFVPLANFVYKKLAIIILGALFLAFVSYGLMIVFFMTSSSWSMPFELSRGHKLVEKVERDLSLLRFRRNELDQRTTSARQEVKTAERDRADAVLKLNLSAQTIAAELSHQVAQFKDLEQHIARLEKVLDDFSRTQGQKRYTQGLKKAFTRRLITKKAYDSGSLSLIETLHRVATLENEISAKRLERKRVEPNILFLQTLLRDINDPELEIETSGSADVALLANEVILAKAKIAAAERTLESGAKRLAQLYDSSAVISENVRSLEATPVARAMTAPVNVLFVPYVNADNMKPGTALYSCRLSIFWCSKVGKIGDPVNGETTSVHPLFGKPLRGTFVEAKFDDPKSVTEEMVHAGGAPFLF